MAIEEQDEKLLCEFARITISVNKKLPQNSDLKKIDV